MDYLREVENKDKKTIVSVHKEWNFLGIYYISTLSNAITILCGFFWSRYSYVVALFFYEVIFFFLNMHYPSQYARRLSVYFK